MPFALIPNAASQRETGKDLLQAARTEFLGRLENPELWKPLGLSGSGKRSFQNRLRQAIKAPLDIERGDSVAGVHQLSPSAQQQILSWIKKATTDLPKSIKALGIELETLHRELDRVESHLRKVPPDEILRPLLGELYPLHQRLGEASKQVLLAEEEIKKNELTLADLKRKHVAMCEKLQEAAGQASKVRLVHNQTVLEEYKAELLKRKIAQIEETVSDCFNALCRKKDTLRRVSVTVPKTFSVTLYDKRDQALPKEQLSAGEKQIYAVSMLWALGKTSGRPLPIIIDTPLARLDSDHRRLLIQNYFPEASHQVMILSTDTEVDQSYFNDLKRDIAHAYKLEFDPEESCTKVSSGYFWRASDEAH